MIARALLVLAVGFAGGCLDELLPSPSLDSGVVDVTAQPSGDSPDLGSFYAADPVDDGGAPASFRDVQAALDSRGCTSSSCHGGTQTPVIFAQPSNESASLANYDDFTVGCTEGAPNSANCVDLVHPQNSLELTKPLATSGVDHMGGKAFADTSDPVYQLWLGWIAAGVPY